MPVRFGLLALLVLVGGLYTQTVNSPFLFDDIPSIVENTRLRNILDLKAIWDFIPSRFMVYWTLALNYHFGQLDVQGYHLVNIAVHLAAAVSVFFLMLTTFQTPRLKQDPLYLRRDWIAFFSAALFAAHPIQTQAVTYVIQRSASLAALFYLSSLLFYARYRALRQAGYFWASMTCGLMAVFSKECTITLPLAVCLYELYFMGSSVKTALKRALPFLGLVAATAAAIFLTNNRTIVSSGGAIRMLGETAAIPWTHYFFTQLTVVATYLRLLLVPLGQNLDYDYPLFQSFFAAPVLASAVLLSALLFITFRLGRNYPLLSFSIAWFFVTLLPESSVFPIKDVIFEHRLYLPMAGYGIFLSCGAFSLLGRKNSKVPVVALMLFLGAYSFLTYQRNLIWKDELTLWTDVIKKSPNKARPYNNRGNVYRARGLFDPALSDYDKAIQNDPSYTESYSNRGTIRQSKGRLDQALDDFNKAIELKPDFAKAYTNRGGIYAARGLWDKALTDFNKAIQLQPDLAGAYNNRGRIHQIQGRLDQAISDFETALKLRPALTEARTNLSRALQQQRG